MYYDSIQDFREKATEKDLKDLENYIKEQPKRTEAFPNEIYNFSYSSAANCLKERGYLGGKKQELNTDPPEFIIRGGEKKEFTTRSFAVQQDILNRIDKLAENNWQYSKKAIINKLLDDALNKYGY
ncbi:MAG: hypothetical protein SO101_00225 [Lachnospiraceae bacterium]|nr:hypothetical protein [Lachnospiraceae bacterium]